MGQRFSERVYQLVKQIPLGKVVTYGQIARFLGINPRTVGWALHTNRDRVAPCQIVSAKRIGVDYAGVWKDKEWRFYIKDNPFVSKNGRRKTRT